MDEEKKNGFLQKLVNSDTGRKAVVIVGIIGIALIFLSSVLSGSGKGEKSTQAATSSAAVQSSDDTYAQQLEQQLTSIISGIRGAGTPHVLVTGAGQRTGLRPDGKALHAAAGWRLRYRSKCRQYRNRLYHCKGFRW